MPSSSPRLGNGGPSTRHRTPTTVYILTAGRSPALGPFCTNYNKSLLPVGGKAVLSLLIRLFPQDRWTKFVIATGFEAQKVKDYVHCAHPNIDVTFVDVPNYDGPGSGPGASLLACKNAAVATAGETSPFYIVVGDLFISNVKEDGMATASWSVMQPSDLFPGGPGARDGATVGARPSGHRKRVPANSCNWVATQFVSPFGSDKYCNFALGEKGSVLQVKNRQIYGSYQDASWIGLAYVQNADAFWVGLETEVARKLELAQNAAPGVKVPPSEIVAGFEYMLESGYDLKARQYRSWVDIGSPGEYLDLVKEHLGAGFDYGKTGEHLYFCGGRVIKFFEDAEITAQRVARCQMVPGVFPNVDRFQGNFYSYKFIDGEVLYRKCDDHVFQMLLEFLETKVWPGPPSREGSTSHSDEQEDEQEFEAACFRFYVEKTRKRVAAYLAKYPDRTALDHADRVARINGVQVEGIQKLIDERVDWNHLLKERKACFFHGDLQFDNILYNDGQDLGGDDEDDGSDSPSAAGPTSVGIPSTYAAGTDECKSDSVTTPRGNGATPSSDDCPFTLIDWRNEFGGSQTKGDIYYDLAKLHAGLLLNHDLIKENHFTYAEPSKKSVRKADSPDGDQVIGDIRLDWHARQTCATRYTRQLREYVERKGLSWRKVDLLTSIVYLNMSPLHNNPYDKFLMALARLRIHDSLAA